MNKFYYISFRQTNPVKNSEGCPIHSFPITIKSDLCPFITHSHLLNDVMIYRNSPTISSVKSIPSDIKQSSSPTSIFISGAVHNKAEPQERFLLYS